MRDVRQAAVCKELQGGCSRAVQGAGGSACIARGSAAACPAQGGGGGAILQGVCRERLARPLAGASGARQAVAGACAGWQRVPARPDGHSSGKLHRGHPARFCLACSCVPDTRPLPPASMRAQGACLVALLALRLSASLAEATGSPETAQQGEARGRQGAGWGRAPWGPRRRRRTSARASRLHRCSMPSAACVCADELERPSRSLLQATPVPPVYKVCTSSPATAGMPTPRRRAAALTVGFARSLYAGSAPVGDARPSAPAGRGARHGVRPRRRNLPAGADSSAGGPCCLPAIHRSRAVHQGLWRPQPAV